LADSYRRAPVVGGERCSGQVARLIGGEEGDDLGDLLDLGAASEQGGLAQLLDEGCLSGVLNTGPAATALTRTPRRLNSAAQERVTELRAALVAP
jgi:hypothetical protein